MKLLLDNNLSPRLCELLGREGWDVTHVGALGLRAADDLRSGSIVVIGEDSMRIRPLPL